MKKIYVLKTLVLFSLLLLSNALIAQFNWFPDDAVWYNTYADFIKNGYAKIEIENDTIVSGISCKKISVVTTYVSYPDNQVDSTGYDSYVYVEDNIVYAFNSYDNIFDTLYNFNADIGDRWEIFSGTCEFLNATAEVTDTGSMVLGSEQLKWMSVIYHNTAYDFWTDTIIEKVGSTKQGLLQYTLCATDPVELFCSYQDSFTGVYPEDASHCDTLIFLGMENLSLDVLSIGPNPAHDQLQVSFSGGTALQIGQVSIFDMFGRSLLFLNGIPKSIDVSSFTNGIYLIRIESSTMVTYLRFLKN